jgi:hypothetical protein
VWSWATAGVQGVLKRGCQPLGWMVTGSDMAGVVVLIGGAFGSCAREEALSAGFAGMSRHGYVCTAAGYRYCCALSCWRHC